MRSIPLLIGIILSIVPRGFTETIITAQDYAVDSDVVLESVVSEVKSVPKDAANMVGDVFKYVDDEAKTAISGVKAIRKSNPVEEVKKAAALKTASAWDASNDVLFRSYKVSSKVGKELLAAGSGDGEDPAVDVSGFFNGVKFVDGTSAFYRPEFSRLLVRQTLENILVIEAVLAEHHNVQRRLMGHQVEIETKFVEVNQHTLNELGFNWSFADADGSIGLFDNFSTPASGTLFANATQLLKGGLRSGTDAMGGPAAGTVRMYRNGTFDIGLLINALEQSDDSDVLSAPRIVTRNGDKATIQVGEEQMFPGRFQVNKIDTSPFVEHLDWNKRLMGVQMDVTPNIREGGLIDLKLHPRIFDVLGVDSYRVTPQYQLNALKQNPPTTLNFSSVAVGAAKLLGVEDSSYRPDIPEVSGSLPYFRVRELQTEVSVADGSTVGMGGLIYDKAETFRDKVPVLGSIPLIGRLFRSEGERSVKRNLMIFVTATEVDVNGRRHADVVLNK